MSEHFKNAFSVEPESSGDTSERSACTRPCSKQCTGEPDAQKPPVKKPPLYSNRTRTITENSEQSLQLVLPRRVARATSVGPMSTISRPTQRTRTITDSSVRFAVTDSTSRLSNRFGIPQGPTAITESQAGLSVSFLEPGPSSVGSGQTRRGGRIAGPATVIAKSIRDLAKYNPEQHTFVRYYWYDYLPQYTGTRSALLSKAFPKGPISTIVWLAYRSIAFLTVFIYMVWHYDIDRMEYWDPDHPKNKHFGQGFMYIENWFLLIFMAYLYCSFLSLWEFHLFNWPFTLPTVPNALVYDKQYWERSKRVINFRRDAGVITKWTNSCYELCLILGTILPVYPIIVRCDPQLDSTPTQGAIAASNSTTQVPPTWGTEDITKAQWIIGEFFWLRVMASIILPFEMFMTSYKITFWHCWHPIVIFFGYVGHIFNEQRKDGFFAKLYPGMFEWSSDSLQTYVTLAIAGVYLIFMYILLWVFDYVLKKHYILDEGWQSYREKEAIDDMHTKGLLGIQAGFGNPLSDNSKRESTSPSATMSRTGTYESNSQTRFINNEPKFMKI